MLVPVTGSMYVRGETTPLDSLLVDVGTGYLIEKSFDEAKAFLDRKMALIDSQAVNVQKTAQIKQSNLQVGARRATREARSPQNCRRPGGADSAPGACGLAQGTVNVMNEKTMMAHQSAAAK